MCELYDASDFSFIFDDEVSSDVCPICHSNPAELDSFTNQLIYCQRCRTAINRQKGFDVIKSEVGIPTAYLKYSWSDYDVEKFKKIVEGSKRFTSNVLLQGESFVGKTVLMSAIADYLVRKGESSILFWNVPELCNYALSDDFANFNKVATKCSKVRYLLLDDIFNGLNPAENKLLYGILDYRNRNNLPTISSTNVNITDARILSRLLRDNGLEIKLTQDIWRNK